jgi:hypothetical protein
LIYVALLPPIVALRQKAASTAEYIACEAIYIFYAVFLAPCMTDFDFYAQVSPNSPAEADGRIQKGDCLLQVFFLQLCQLFQRRMKFSVYGFHTCLYYTLHLTQTAMDMRTFCCSLITHHLPLWDCIKGPMCKKRAHFCMRLGADGNFIEYLASESSLCCAYYAVVDLRPRVIDKRNFARLSSNYLHESRFSYGGQLCRLMIMETSENQ